MSWVEKTMFYSVAKDRKCRGLRSGVLISRLALKWMLFIDKIDGHLQSVARPWMYQNHTHEPN